MGQQKHYLVSFWVNYPTTQPSINWSTFLVDLHFDYDSSNDRVFLGWKFPSLEYNFLLTLSSWTFVSCHETFLCQASCSLDALSSWLSSDVTLLVHLRGVPLAISCKFLVPWMHWILGSLPCHPFESAYVLCFPCTAATFDAPYFVVPQVNHTAFRRFQWTRSQ